MRSALITLAVLFCATTVAAEKMTFDRLYSIPSYGDIQVAPDGYHIRFVMRTNDLDENKSVSHIWRTTNVGDYTYKATNGPTSEWHPRWLPDGKRIFFLSDRDSDRTQIWQMGFATGSRKVTDLSTGVSSFEIFPDGHRLLVQTRVYPDCHSDSCNERRLAENESNPVQAGTYDRLLYRHYYRWDDGRVNRLLTYDMHTGTYTEVYSGPHDAPTSLLGGYGDYAISPDNEEICFVMHTDSMPAVWPNNDLFVIPSNGGEPIRITDNEGLDTSPRYSPDGRFIAYHEQARKGYESDQRDLVLYDRQTGDRNNLTGSFDRSVGQYCWSPDAKYIYFLAIEHGFNKIWRADIEQEKIELLWKAASYGNLAIHPDGGSLFVTRSLSDKPYEIIRVGVDSSSWLQITDSAEQAVSGIEMNQAEEFWFEGALGDSVHGFLTLPPDFDSTRKYPLVLLIHGGPQWCWLGHFNYYGWNTQLMAAQGYVVAQIDPHGSIAYGLAFKEYVSGNWGRGDYEDLMKGVDYLIETRPFIDSTRMAALGRSYGGFMTNWICGHTDRFRCLITIDGTSEHVSQYGATEELWFPEWEYKGTPWTNREEYDRSSPITYAADFKTPMMIIHGQRDYRVDLSQALQMFTALQRQGVPSELVYFPDEGHSIGKLANLRYVYDKQLNWLKRWLVP